MLGNPIWTILFLTYEEQDSSMQFSQRPSPPKVSPNFATYFFLFLSLSLETWHKPHTVLWEYYCKCFLKLQAMGLKVGLGDPFSSFCPESLSRVSLSRVSEATMRAEVNVLFLFVLFVCLYFWQSIHLKRAWRDLRMLQFMSTSMARPREEKSRNFWCNCVVLMQEPVSLEVSQFVEESVM